MKGSHENSENSYNFLSNDPIFEEAPIQNRPAEAHAQPHAIYTDVPSQVGLAHGTSVQDRSTSGSSGPPKTFDDLIMGSVQDRSTSEFLGPTTAINDLTGNRHGGMNLANPGLRYCHDLGNLANLQSAPLVTSTQEALVKKLATDVNDNQIVEKGDYIYLPKISESKRYESIMDSLMHCTFPQTIFERPPNMLVQVVESNGFLMEESKTVFQFSGNGNNLSNSLPETTSNTSSDDGQPNVKRQKAVRSYIGSISTPQGLEVDEYLPHAPLKSGIPLEDFWKTASAQTIPSNDSHLITPLINGPQQESKETLLQSRELTTKERLLAQLKKKDWRTLSHQAVNKSTRCALKSMEYGELQLDGSTDPPITAPATPTADSDSTKDQNQDILPEESLSLAPSYESKIVFFVKNVVYTPFHWCAAEFMDAFWCCGTGIMYAFCCCNFGWRRRKAVRSWRAQVEEPRMGDDLV